MGNWLCGEDSNRHDHSSDKVPSKRGLVIKAGIDYSNNPNSSVHGPRATFVNVEDIQQAAKPLHDTQQHIGHVEVEALDI